MTDKVGVGGSSPLISTKISLISSDFLFSQPHLVLQSNTQSETLHQGGTLLVYASNLFDIRWGSASAARLRVCDTFASPLCLLDK